MGRILLKQPDGLYALWSTVVDDFIVYDATADEIDTYIVQEAIEKAQQVAMEMIAQAEGSPQELFERKLSFRKELHGALIEPQEDADVPYKAWLDKWGDNT